MQPMLLVDDLPTILKSMSVLLSKAGCPDEQAPNAEAALDKNNGGFSLALVITDYHMPACMESS
jgi:CheY-like chemotaxis protein